MKKSIIAVAIFSIGFTACKSEKKDKIETSAEVKTETPAKQETATTNENIDVAVSSLTWKGTKPGGAHNGMVSLEKGNLALENGTIKGGEFVVDMKSIKVLDIEDAKKNANLVGHLTNADFFEVEKYPTSKFVITSVENKDGKLAVTGNLTIKDVTKSVTIPAVISQNDGITTFKSDVFKIDRSDFNIKYKSKKFFDNLKDKFIDDLMEFSFEVKTKK